MTAFENLIGSSKPPVLEAMSVDDLCMVLGTKRRRLVIEAVAEHGELTPGDLSEHVAREEHGRDFGKGQRKSAYVSIYQTHLPLLDEHDVLVVTDDTVSPGPNHAAALDCIRELQRRVDGGKS